MVFEDYMIVYKGLFNFYYRLKTHPYACAHEGYLAFFATPPCLHIFYYPSNSLQIAFKFYKCLQIAFK